MNNTKKIDDEYRGGLIRKCQRLLNYLADKYPYGNRNPRGDRLKDKVHHELEKLIK
jgi:hypothetical protein